VRNTDIILAKLREPFPPERISWRVGARTKDKTKGMALAYIDARDVYERLDEACGPGGWQCEHFDGGDGRLTCKIGLLLGDEWIWKSDGAGARQADRGLSEQDANKGDYSDALKRAAVAWGVGRYLYELPAPWVRLTEGGFAIDDSEYPKLEKLLKDYTAGLPREDHMGAQMDPRTISNGRQKNSSQAKKAGDDKIVEEMERCISADMLDTWLEENRDRIASLPVAWQNAFWGRFDVHRDSLTAKAA